MASSSFTDPLGNTVRAMSTVARADTAPMAASHGATETSADRPVTVGTGPFTAGDTSGPGDEPAAAPPVGLVEADGFEGRVADRAGAGGHDDAGARFRPAVDQACVRDCGRDCRLVKGNTLDTQGFCLPAL